MRIIPKNPTSKQTNPEKPELQPNSSEKFQRIFKKLSHCHKLEYSNSSIFADWWCIIIRLFEISKVYEIGIRKSEFI